MSKLIFQFTLASLLFIFISQTSNAEVFIVNSNAGAGIGTLREALDQATANGIIDKDYIHFDANNVEVATTIDLINQPPGIYTLEVTDQSDCGSVSTPPIRILESNPITINDSQIQLFNPTCVGNNGSVKGLQITGATSYTWKNSAGQSVGTQADLEGVPPGNYQLIASNSFCSETYNAVLVTQPNLINHTGTTKVLIDATCGLNNGKITVILISATRFPKSYRWVDQLGRAVDGNTATIENIDAGTYSVYGTDDNDCEIFLATYSINRRPNVTLNSDNHQIVNDKCNQSLGGITALQVKNGLAPYAFKWTNEAGTVVGTTLNINNLSKGNYTLKITDALNCVPIMSNFTIDNQDQEVSAPIVSPIQLCAPGTATLNIKGSENATSYALYLNEDSMLPFDITKNGVFKVDIKNDKSYFITQRVGDCESQRVEVKVTVGLSGLTIANTFTPNNDGINDVWNLKGIENYPNAYVQIFNRVGNKVYDSIGYITPFDGTYIGKILPMGVYYYVIKLGPACETINGTLTLIK